jgi:hypothetical protein
MCATAAVITDPKETIETLRPPGGVTKNPYKTRCPGCTSMIHLALPMVHCPCCHNVYRARKLTAPTRCARCDFNLFRWRNQIGVRDDSVLGALA